MSTIVLVCTACFITAAIIIDHLKKGDRFWIVAALITVAQVVLLYIAISNMIQAYVPKETTQKVVHQDKIHDFQGIYVRIDSMYIPVDSIHFIDPL